MKIIVLSSLLKEKHKEMILDIADKIKAENILICGKKFSVVISGEDFSVIYGKNSFSGKTGIDTIMI